jgi:hypothetical protein
MVMILGVSALATGCEERDRLTFPDPGDGIGPVTTFDQPTQGDTTVSAGPDFFVHGRTIDPDGVDTVYFLVTGGTDHIPPFRPSPPTDTVRFGLLIRTSGLAGETVLVQVHGVDAHGNQGAASLRQIMVE